MRNKANRLIYPWLIMGLLLIFTGSCKKDDNNNTGIPVLTTTAVTDITGTTAKSGGTITSDGGATITARGACWSTSQSPTISDNKTTDGTGIGTFVSNISSLTATTTYYLRAYATNSNGTGYGSVISFTTTDVFSTFTDSRDGTVYKTVSIGDQIWMAENLKYLPSVTGPDSGSLITPYYYVHGYSGTDINAAKSTPNYTTYGVLYNWPAAMAGSSSSSFNPSGVQGVCPPGWHLPSDAEWTELTDYLGGEGESGAKLKETGNTHWDNPNTGTTNETGFTALPGGNRGYDGTFGGIGGYGYWWSASETITSKAWGRGLSSSYSGVYRDHYNKELGYSVRCLKD